MAERTRFLRDHQSPHSPGMVLAKVVGASGRSQGVANLVASQLSGNPRLPAPPLQGGYECPHPNTYTGLQQVLPSSLALSHCSAPSRPESALIGSFQLGLWKPSGSLQADSVYSPVVNGSSAPCHSRASLGGVEGALLTQGPKAPSSFRSGT